jgi:hypothetical protein
VLSINPNGIKYSMGLKAEEISCYTQTTGGVPKWLRERSAKPPFSGSNPLAASIDPAGSLSTLLSFTNRGGKFQIDSNPRKMFRCLKEGSLFF